MDKPLVKVVWLDAHGTAATSYADFEIPHSAAEYETYGLLLKDDEAGVSIANERCVGDSTYRGYTFIPKALVKSIEYVVKPRVSRRKAQRTPEPALESPRQTE